MNAIVTLPHFAHALFHDRVRCPRCQTNIVEQDVRFAGAGKSDQDGTVCFMYQYQCSKCQKVYAVVDRTRVCARPEWWTEIAVWHEENLDDIKLPRIGTMILDMIELDSIAIRGGYKGEVGPVILIYSHTRSKLIAGFVTLERDSTISLYEHDAPLGLSRKGLREFNMLDEGDMFDFRDRRWTKMTASEIAEIITDRVFKVSTEPEDDGVTTPKPSARRVHGKGKTTPRPARKTRPRGS